MHRRILESAKCIVHRTRRVAIGAGLALLATHSVAAIPGMLLAAGHAVPENYRYVLAIGKNGAACGTAGETVRSAARAFLHGEIAQLKDLGLIKSIGVSVVQADASVRNEPAGSADTVLAAVDALVDAAPDAGGLPRAITAAGADPVVMTVLTDGANATFRDALAMASGVSKNVRRLRIVALNAPVAAIETNEFLTQIPCRSDTSTASYISTWLTLQAALARRTGLPLDGIRPEQRLQRDLALDPMALGELVDRVARELTGAEIETPIQAEKVGELQLALAKLVDAQGGFKLRTAPTERKAVTVPVYFATNRRTVISASGDFEAFGERNPDHDITYGVARVTIPLPARPRPSTLAMLLTLDAGNRSPKITQIGKRDVTSFFKALAQTYEPGADWKNDLVIFVHGYNVTFTDAVRRAAQIKHDVDFPGTVSIFSWPSVAELSGYVADRENIEWSLPYIERFLREVLRNNPERRVHLIAHSMGNEGVTRALLRLALDPAVPDAAFFNVISAAPDVDAEIFSDHIAPRAKRIARRWTVYASDKDAALNVSATLRKHPRLGSPIPAVKGVDLIDASGLSASPWSIEQLHSYFAAHRDVVQDMRAVLRGATPEERKLLRKTSENYVYWSVPETK